MFKIVLSFRFQEEITPSIISCLALIHNIIVKYDYINILVFVIFQLSLFQDIAISQRVVTQN